MLEILNTYRGISYAAITIKLVLALFFGGLIGIEREFKQRPAGSRTHMLICLGASMTMVVNQELILRGGNVDPARIGAQVVAGIGFIGAGTIVVSHRNKVRGLTTAAGLWTTAVIGLALGCGYYECALAVTVLVLFTELVLSKVERIRQINNREINLYVEYETQSGYVSALTSMLTRQKIKISDLEALKKGEKKNVLLMTLILPKKIENEDLMRQVKGMDATTVVEVL